MSPFKNISGTRYLQALFYERVGEDKSAVVYTLKDQDHEGYPSLYRLYMEASDPTEYSFAVSHLDGYEHWQMLTRCTWFKPFVARWRQELAAKLAYEALEKIKAHAQAGGKESYLANKYLLERSEKLTGKIKKPSLPEVAQDEETHQQASQAQEIAFDAKRLLEGHLN